MKENWTSLASLVGVFAFIQTLLQTLFPPELRFASLNFFNNLFLSFSSYCYFHITDTDGLNTNELYDAVHLYLTSSAVSSSSTPRHLTVTRPLNSTAFTFGLSNDATFADTFRGAGVLWEHVVTQRQPHTFSWRPLPEEKRSFTLRIKKQDKPLLLTSYLDHIMEKANEIRRRNQDRVIYTNSRGGPLDSGGNPWESVPFKHSSTFETLAMEPERKKMIMEDLESFVKGKEFYEKTGRAWKRGYLLYGPPGTGKSSMIAAMANFLGYDIYDLELTEVHDNSELRRILMKTSSKSIIVIEDIDCSISLTNRKKKKSKNHGTNKYYDSEKRGGEECGGNSITLSGLLNFSDGLWSCCGSERIFVFTTNYIEKIDSALLRSGRMDMYIFMSYCSFQSLKILLRNYLGVEESDLKDSILRDLEEVIEKAKMTPADISEVLIKNRRRKEKAVRELLETMKLRAEKKEKNGELKEKNRDGDEKRTVESPKHESEVEDDLKEGEGGQKKRSNDKRKLKL